MRSVSWLLAELQFCTPHLLLSLPFFSLLSPSPPSLTALHPPEEMYGCEVRIIAADFSDGPELYPHIAEELQDLDIGLLGKVPSVAYQHLLFFKPLALLCGWTHFTCCLCV